MADLNHSLSILNTSFRNLTQANNSSQVNTYFMEALDELLDGQMFGVFTFSSSEGTISTLTQSAISLDSLGIEDKRSQIIKHLQHDNPGPFVQDSFTVIPYYSVKQCTGFILVKNALSQDEQLVLEHLSQLWIQSKNKLELEQNNHRLARELGRNIHNLSVVRSIAQAVSKAQDLKHLLQLILKVAITTVNAARGFIMLENENTRCLELKVVQGLPNKEAEEKINVGLLKSAGIPIGEGIQGRVMQTLQPVILSDALLNSEPMLGFEGSANSLMCVPLLMHDKAFGVIYVTNKEAAEPFEKDDLDVLSILAAHASAVLDQARLYNLATTDELTGLYTRRYYSQRIGDEYSRTMRYQRHLSLLVLDIDHFKKTNDKFGHLAGDQVLKCVARILKTFVRSDIDSAVRFGGEEFVLILPETHLRGAKIVGERIRKAVENEPIEFQGQRIPTTISVGASSYPENGSSIEELFNLADRALYLSKSGGRNLVTSIPEL